MGLKVSFIDASLLLVTLFLSCSPVCYFVFCVVAFLSPDFSMILTFARSAHYGDDMDEFNGTGRGRGRYYQVAWALKKMNMLSCAVSVLYCVLSRFHVIFCVC